MNENITFEVAPQPDGSWLVGLYMAGDWKRDDIVRQMPATPHNVGSVLTDMLLDYERTLDTQ